MTRSHWRTGLFTLLAALAAAGIAQAQNWGRLPPNVGYAYPAGARQGQEVTIDVGGQYLDNYREVIVSGEGVTAEVVDHYGPPKQKDIGKIRELLRNVEKELREEAAKGKRPTRPQIRAAFVERAKEEGFTDKQLEGFRRWRQQRNDPKRQLNPQLSEYLKVRLKVSEDAEPGIRELRVATKFGLSNPQRICVGTLGEACEAEPNDDPAKATEVADLPALLNGQIMPGDVDHWRFSARRGQKLVARVGARELVPYLADAVPGWFQATVALLDAEGTQVAYVDDFRFNPDPVLMVEIPADGQYTLEIRDSIYRGREDFVYRIALGELPLVTNAFPMGGRCGETTAITVEGWNLPEDARTISFVADQPGVHPVSVDPELPLCTTIALSADSLPERVETELNDRMSTAEAVELPQVINGRIDEPGDRDVFRFSATGGETIIAEVHARRLGSPVDSLLWVTDAAGKQLAVNDDHVDPGQGLMTHHADSLLVFDVPARGDYLLHLADAQAKGGPAYTYRLRLSRRQADFALRVTPSALSARGGTAVPVTVFACRKDGFDGEIELRLADAPEGYSLSGARIPAGQNEVTLTLTVPGQPEAEMAQLSLEGIARAGDRQIVRPAVPADDEMQAFIYHHLVPAESWTVTVEPAPGKWGKHKKPWKLGEGEPLTLTAGGTTSGYLKMNWKPKGEVFVDLADAPKGISVERVEEDDKGVTVVIRADADKVPAGMEGNLILNLSFEREPPKDRPGARARRIPMGTIEAVPFKVVGGRA